MLPLYPKSYTYLAKLNEEKCRKEPGYECTLKGERRYYHNPVVKLVVTQDTPPDNIKAFFGEGEVDYVVAG